MDEAEQRRQQHHDNVCLNDLYCVPANITQREHNPLNHLV